MRSVFVDTGPLIALADASDENHEAAQTRIRNMPEGVGLVTSNYVLGETASHLARSGHGKEAVTYVRGILKSRFYRVYHVDERMLDLALEMMLKYCDRPITFTDATTMAIAQSRNVGAIYSFDRKFSTAGFEVIN